MRVAVISDIHGNAVGLDAVISDVSRHPVDRWICLGDALQGGPQPAQVIDRLEELGCTTILGNADAFVLTGTVEERSLEAVSPDLTTLRDWTAEQIGERGLDFIRSFVPTLEVDLQDAGTLLCFHGTPASYNDVLLPETPRDDLARALDSAANVYCGGHTHLQWTATFDSKTYFNPGSVGLSYNRHLDRESFYLNPFAEFAVLSIVDATFRLEFAKVPLDIDLLIQSVQSSGRPLAERDVRLYERARTRD